MPRRCEADTDGGTNRVEHRERASAFDAFELDIVGKAHSLRTALLEFTLQGVNAISQRRRHLLKFVLRLYMRGFVRLLGGTHQSELRSERPRRFPLFLEMVLPVGDLLMEGLTLPF